MDRLPGVFSFPFVLSLSLRNEGRGLSATTGVCPGVLLGLLSPWDQARPFSWSSSATAPAASDHCRGAEMQLLLCLQFPSSCFHQHFYGLNPALMNSIFSTLTAQCPPRHTFSDVMLCDPTKAVSLLLWYLLIAKMEHFELFLPSVCCIRLLLAFTCYVRSQEICIFPRGEAVLCLWDPAWDTCNSSMIRNPV